MEVYIETVQTKREGGEMICVSENPRTVLQVSYSLLLLVKKLSEHMREAMFNIGRYGWLRA